MKTLKKNTNHHSLITPHTSKEFNKEKKEFWKFRKLSTELGIDLDEIEASDIILHIEPKNPYILTFGKQLLRVWGICIM